jgi:hypothetical protein
MKKLIPFLLLLPTILTGCLGPKVPATKISFDQNTKQLTISSPKNVCITSLVVSEGTNGFNLTVNGYTSTNDNQVVNTISQAQAQIAKNASDTINNLATMATAIAAKAP